jgi:glutamate decarboxylase
MEGKYMIGHSSNIYYREGYKILQQACLDHGKYIAEEVAKLGDGKTFNILYNGVGGLPGACWTLKPGDHPFNLYDLSDKMRSRGWQIASYPLTGSAEDIVVQRVLIRHGFSRGMAELLIEDLKRCFEHFKENPVVHHLPRKYGGFDHSCRHTEID